MPADLLHKFVSHCKAAKLIDAGHNTLLAVSGGSDSMVMASLFLRAGYKFGVAHCNFGLRGAEADLDEQLVRDWCAMNGIVFHHTRFATKERAAEWKKGTQETARILRYEWFEQVRREHGYTHIATAHHANDNMETLLMNLFKGSGIAGLHGIPRVNGNIIRPLLFATKEDITTWIEQDDIIYRDDASNSSDDYLRNAVRHHLVPAIEKLFPSAVERVGDTTQRIAEAEVLYHSAMEGWRKKLLEKRGNDYYIPVLKLERCTPLPTICYELCQPFGFAPGQLPDILGLLQSGTGHYVASASHRIIRNRDFLVITTVATEDAGIVLVEATPCIVHTSTHKFSFTMQEYTEGTTIPADPAIACLDMKDITFPLILRPWKMGDYLYPLGMKMKKKKVSRLLIDQKVPLHQKEQVRILECNKKVLWVSGIRPDERFKVSNTTKQMLVVKCEALV